MALHIRVFSINQWQSDNCMSQKIMRHTVVVLPLMESGSRVYYAPTVGLVAVRKDEV